MPTGPALKKKHPLCLFFMPATRDQVLAVHEPAYLDAVERGVPRALAEAQDFPWHAQLWPMSLAASGGLIAAAAQSARR